MVKTQSIDGSFERQKLVGVLSQCKGVALSPDEQYVYLSGFQILSSVVMKFNAGDLSLVNSRSFSSWSILSFYSFSYSGFGEMLLVNSISSQLFGKYQFSAIDMSVISGSKQWSKQLSCTGS